MLDDISVPGWLAGPDEDIGADELSLAARNHGLPLEALRYDLTPSGLHYLLIHYDIPVLDPATWRLRVGGLLGTPVELDLAALRAMTARTVRVTLECAGNGRARLHPRPVSQPWLVEAVGTAEWTGVPLRDILAVAGVDPAAVEVVFTGADHGIERGVEQDYQRSLSVGDALGVDVLLIPTQGTAGRGGGSPTSGSPHPDGMRSPRGRIPLTARRSRSGRSGTWAASPTTPPTTSTSSAPRDPTRVLPAGIDAGHGCRRVLP